MANNQNVELEEFPAYLPKAVGIDLVEALIANQEPGTRREKMFYALACRCTKIHGVPHIVSIDGRTHVQLWAMAEQHLKNANTNSREASLLSLPVLCSECASAHGGHASHADRMDFDARR